MHAIIIHKIIATALVKLKTWWVKIHLSLVSNSSVSFRLRLVKLTGLRSSAKCIFHFMKGR